MLDDVLRDRERDRGRCCNVLESVTIWELGLPSSKRVASDAALVFPDMMAATLCYWGR